MNIGVAQGGFSGKRQASVDRLLRPDRGTDCQEVYIIKTGRILACGRRMGVYRIGPVQPHDQYGGEDESSL